MNASKKYGVVLIGLGMVSKVYVEALNSLSNNISLIGIIASNINSSNKFLSLFYLFKKDQKIEALKSLVVKINDKMSQIGFKKDSELFIPHITVAKINYPQKFNPDLSIFLNSTYDEVEFSVDKIQLLESKTLTEGVVYETLNTFSFLEK